MGMTRGTRARARTFAALTAAVAVTLLSIVGAPSAAAISDYPGASAGSTYDNAFHIGLELPPSLYTDRFVPQGLALWNNWAGSTEDVFLVTAYDDDDGNGDTDGDSVIYGVSATTGLSVGRTMIMEGHVDGIAVVGSWVFVVSGTELRTYSTSSLRARLVDGSYSDYMGMNHFRYLSHDGNFASAYGGDLYIGDFKTSGSPKMYRYDVSTSGAAASSSASYPVPLKTQGLAITSSHFYFSTSYGRGNLSTIYVQRRTESLSAAYHFSAPSMTEGLAIWGNEANADRLYVVFESAAYTYRDSRNPIKNLHWSYVSTLAAWA